MGCKEASGRRLKTSIFWPRCPPGLGKLFTARGKTTKTRHKRTLKKKPRHKGTKRVRSGGPHCRGTLTLSRDSGLEVELGVRGFVFFTFFTFSSGDPRSTNFSLLVP